MPLYLQERASGTAKYCLTLNIACTVKTQSCSRLARTSKLTRKQVGDYNCFPPPNLAAINSAESFLARALRKVARIVVGAGRRQCEGRRASRHLENSLSRKLTELQWTNKRGSKCKEAPAEESYLLPMGLIKLVGSRHWSAQSTWLLAGKVAWRYKWRMRKVGGVSHLSAGRRLSRADKRLVGRNCRRCRQVRCRGGFGKLTESALEGSPAALL